MCECEYNFPNNRANTGGNTQQHEFEYQAAHAKYRAEQQSMIFSLINTICPSQTYSGVKHEFEQSPFSFVVSIFNTL